MIQRSGLFLILEWSHSWRWGNHGLSVGIILFDKDGLLLRFGRLYVEGVRLHDVGKNLLLNSTKQSWDK